MHRRMSDARQSPIPQDRVNENVDEAARADQSRQEQRMNERSMQRDSKADDLPGTDPDAQPGIPNEPKAPADGGD
jgi:hypothetical protein